jgi:hypothetical protein
VTSEENGLRGFLAPSPASLLLAPLLRALYCRLGAVVEGALAGLRGAVESGFFMGGAHDAAAAAAAGAPDDAVGEGGLWSGGSEGVR